MQVMPCEQYANATSKFRPFRASKVPNWRKDTFDWNGHTINAHWQAMPLEANRHGTHAAMLS